MGKIWEFFEHLDEYVYVSDPETNQLVYMNQKALKSYGFQSKEEIVGLKCYEVLQGLDTEIRFYYRIVIFPFLKIAGSELLIIADTAGSGIPL